MLDDKERAARREVRHVVDEGFQDRRLCQLAAYVVDRVTQSIVIGGLRSRLLELFSVGEGLSG
jgi:hypothetical protein